MAYLVALGCLGTALVVLLLDGEVVLSMGGFGVGLETEFALVLVKEKGLGGAGALRESIDSNSSFPVITDTWNSFSNVGNFTAHAGLQVKHVLLWIWVAHLWLGYLDDHIGCKSF